MRAYRCLAALLAALLLVSCAGQGAGNTPTPGPETAATPTPTTAPATLTPSPNGNLVLWLVPQFAPSTDSPAGALLLARLQAFEVSHPGLTITTRIKQQDGSGGLIETLQAAFIASPATLPDIVVLNERMLPDAAIAGLILPLNDIIPTPSSPTWYDFGLEASLIDDHHYGLPFAADAEILAYSVAAYAAMPRTWADLIEGPPQFMFPAGDPQASFTISQYLAVGGLILGSTDDPMVQTSALTEVFSFYAQLASEGVLPAVARQYTTASETWELHRSAKAVASLAPLSDFFDTYVPGQTSAAPLPSSTASDSIYVETWSWAIVPHDPVHQALAAELLQWLSDPEFLGPWTDALNLLPPSAGALAAWPDGSRASIASRLVTIARSRPSDEILDILGPPIRDAISQILTNAATPEEAAAAVISALNAP